MYFTWHLISWRVRCIKRCVQICHSISLKTHLVIRSSICKCILNSTRNHNCVLYFFCFRNWKWCCCKFWNVIHPLLVDGFKNSVAKKEILKELNKCFVIKPSFETKIKSLLHPMLFYFLISWCKNTTIKFNEDIFSSWNI